MKLSVTTRPFSPQAGDVPSTKTAIAMPYLFGIRLFRRIHRTHIRARAAFNALFLINNIFAVACADTLHRTFIFARAAIDARISNNISHLDLL